MKRDAVYYVMPMGENWLLRAIGSSAEAYPTFEDALAAADRLAARGAHIRVLSRALASSISSPGLASTSTVTKVADVVDHESDPVRRAAS